MIRTRGVMVLELGCGHVMWTEEDALGAGEWECDECGEDSAVVGKRWQELGS